MSRQTPCLPYRDGTPMRLIASVKLAVIAESTRIHSSPSRNTRTPISMNATVELVPGCVGSGVPRAVNPCQMISAITKIAAPRRPTLKVARSEGRRENALIWPFPRARVLTGARWLRDHHYSQIYSWRGRANGNRGVDRGRARRRRPWEKEDPVSNQMPHEPFYPGPVAC